MPYGGLKIEFLPPGFCDSDGSAQRPLHQAERAHSFEFAAVAIEVAQQLTNFIWLKAALVLRIIGR
jgi:hypothetical protein